MQRWIPLGRLINVLCPVLWERKITIIILQTSEIYKSFKIKSKLEFLRSSRMLLLLKGQFQNTTEFVVIKINFYLLNHALSS